DSNWKKAVDYLLFQKRQVMLIQVLSPEEVNPEYNGRIRLVDIEADDPMDDRHIKMKITKSHIKAYKEALKDFIDDIKHFCSSREVDFVSVTSDEPIEKLLFERLFVTGIIR
ncbi:MAG: hypothetical protein K2K12_03640, partial [Clostridia bacterium]|nr:hypothetical protein [Clostridia bacterium]